MNCSGLEGESCGRPVFARGFCQKHYRWSLRHKSITSTRTNFTTEEIVSTVCSLPARGVTVRQVAKATGLSERWIRKKLADICRSGSLERTGWIGGRVLYRVRTDERP